MKSTLVFLATALLILTASCGKKVIIDENIPFDNGVWMRFEPVQYTVDVNDIEPYYQVSVTLRYDTSRYTDNMLPLLVDYYRDSNELHNFIPNIRLRTKNGKLRGETIGSYCTVTDTIDRRRLYNHPGTYTYRIKQRTSKYEIYGINSLTLKIEKL